MITTQKDICNEAPTNHNRVVVARLPRVSARHYPHVQDDTDVLDSWRVGQAEATALAVGFLLASLVFLGLHNALTGEATETQPGQASHWKGPKLRAQVARVQWGAR